MKLPEALTVPWLAAGLVSAALILTTVPADSASVACQISTPSPVRNAPAFVQPLSVTRISVPASISRSNTRLTESGVSEAKPTTATSPAASVVWADAGSTLAASSKAAASDRPWDARTLARQADEMERRANMAAVEGVANNPSLSPLAMKAPCQNL